MLDKFITPVIKPLLTPVVALLHQRNVTADQITFYGFLVGMLALPLLAFQLWYWALSAVIVNRILDGLDGALARYAKQSSSAGGFLDITLDFLFYAAIPLGFILANPEQNAIAGAVLLTTFIGTGSSFLAFAIAAEKFNIDKPQFKYKSFYYLNGLTEGTETIALFIAFCIWPQHFAVLAYLFAIACAITIFTRIHGGYHTLKQQKLDVNDAKTSKVDVKDVNINEVNANVIEDKEESND
ncbi:CDP-alcohol phosphatidyltransferase family protein [Colwellia sp. E2M01]|uniref:CDP-alcohol phosphatidyltransferase family protein n=1 Tax=Colwellia sp. E2M01 TaxID=2841561 RepID=UPI001C0A1D97|nr:CDP-alcohol phosphatidyltransferase family protein [Colwellia sp. E2M01]MBU2870089.1 CDP-alcohol phosphatidyltransferase family protein [Colwellia sp. E2M01]